MRVSLGSLRRIILTEVRKPKYVLPLLKPGTEWVTTAPLIHRESEPGELKLGSKGVEAGLKYDEDEKNLHADVPGRHVEVPRGSHVTVVDLHSQKTEKLANGKWIGSSFSPGGPYELTIVRPVISYNGKEYTVVYAGKSTFRALSASQAQGKGKENRPTTEQFYDELALKPVGNWTDPNGKPIHQNTERTLKNGTYKFLDPATNNVVGFFIDVNADPNSEHYVRYVRKLGTPTYVAPMAVNIGQDMSWPDTVKWWLRRKAKKNDHADNTYNKPSETILAYFKYKNPDGDVLDLGWLLYTIGKGNEAMEASVKMPEDVRSKVADVTGYGVDIPIDGFDAALDMKKALPDDMAELGAAIVSACVGLFS